MRQLLKTQIGITHTRECIQAAEKYDTDSALFDEKYPNHCRVCGGERWTWSEYYYKEPPTEILCPACEYEGICGLCGELEDTYDLVCPNNCPEYVVTPFFECMCWLTNDY